MKKKIYPNCAKCLWIGFQFISDFYCSAQGGKRANKCYNNKICIQLYKEKSAI